MRYSLRNMLWATFWFTAWLAVCINYEWLSYLLRDERYGIPIFLPLWVLLVGGPFIIVGSFRGRTLRGVLVGFYIAAALILVANWL